MSLTPSNIMDILSNNFFGGDDTLAGLIVFSAIILAVFTLTRKAFVGFVVMIPVTLAFSYFGALPDTMMIILIVVSVLGIAITSRKVVGGDL